MAPPPDPFPAHHPPHDPGLHSMPTADVRSPDPSRESDRRSHDEGPDGHGDGAGSSAAPGRIGSYQIVSLLGEGGFGMVYLADQLEPVRRRVAIKVASPGSRSERALARFEAERQALAMMDHPGVAAVFDAGYAPDGRPYFAMEFVPGRSITRYALERRLDVDARVRLMVQVCEAVQHAHQKGIIHRDLKPGNILVEEIDGRPQPKVIDFGVAKALGERLSDTPHRTVEGQVIGTPEYMAPEQARGDNRDVDTRADIYSLGVVLYELLTGRTPVAGEELRAAGVAGLAGALTRFAVARPSERVSREGPGPLHAPGDAEPDRGALARRLRGDLDWIAMRCLEKERDRRYASAGELAAELRRFLDHEPVLAGPPSAAYRAAKFIRRHRALVAGAGVVALALLIGAAGTGVGLAWALRERDNARAQERAALGARDESDAVTDFLSNMFDAAAPGERGRDLRVLDVLDHAAAELPTRFADKPAVLARLSATIGNTYRSLGSPEQAERHLLAAHETRKRTLGEGHPLTVRALGNVAGLRHEQGRIDEAVKLIEQALAAIEASPSRDSEAALGIKNNLAQAYARMGRAREARELQRRVVAGMSATLGPEHPTTLGSTVNLAMMLLGAGEEGEGRALMDRAVADWERVHGADHPGALMARHAQATYLFDTAQYAAAEPLLRRVAADRQRVLGPDHQDTIGSTANLGLTMSHLGRPDEAEPVLTSAWARARRVLGDAHPTTLMLTTSLLGLDEARGWPARAPGHHEPRLALLKAAADHPGAGAESLNTAAWYLLHIEPPALRDLGAGHRLAIAACDQARRDQSDSLWMYLDTLAEAQFALDDPAAALATQTEALALIPKSGERYRGEMEERRKKYEARVRGGGK